MKTKIYMLLLAAIALVSNQAKAQSIPAEDLDKYIITDFEELATLDEYINENVWYVGRIWYSGSSSTKYNLTICASSKSTGIGKLEISDIMSMYRGGKSVDEFIKDYLVTVQKVGSKQCIMSSNGKYYSPVYDEITSKNWTDLEGAGIYGTNISPWIYKKGASPNNEAYLYLYPVKFTPIKAQAILMSAINHKLNIGNSFTLNTQIFPSNTLVTAIEWTSSDPTVATVNNGVVYGLKEGETMITATTTDGTELSAQCLVSVKDIIAEQITMATTEYHIGMGESEQATVTILPMDARNKSVTWSSRDESIVQINAETGEFIGLKPGTTIISATTNDGSDLKA